MSKLNNISVDGTVYNINDFHVIKNNSYNNPFIITEHEPGIYIVDSSEADYLPGKLYAKYIDSEDYNVRTEYYDGFLCLTDTSIDDPYTYKNIGYIFDASAGLAHPCVTQPAPWGFSLTGASSGIGNSAVKTIGNQTINGKKVFNTLPESSVIPTTNNQLVNKKYVDDSILPYYDSGYYMQPTSWTVVSEMPAEPVYGRLYFVSPDYVEKNIGTSISSTGFNSGVSWSHITDYFLNTQDLDDVIQTWQNTAPSGASSGTQYTSWLVKVPKYGVAVGATPNFTNSYGEDLHMYGILEQRNPQTTTLMYSAYLDVDENLASGTMYYFDRDEDHSGGTPLTIYGSGVSTAFFYTIGTNGGLACLKGDTPIKISNTKTKQIKNLAVGDTVIDAEGNKVKILKVFSHKVDTTFNITLSNEDTLVASYGHKFSINKHFRRACQIVKDHKLDRNDGSTFDVIATEVKQEEMEVYEILTESGTYVLGNGIICECEAI
jgi:hypothetical protein